MCPTILRNDSILLFDEQERFLSDVCIRLHDNGFKRVLGISDAGKISSFITNSPTDVLIFGLYAPIARNMELLRETLHNQPGLKAIVISASNEQETAIECMKLGIIDYLSQPLDINRLITTLGSTLGTSSFPERHRPMTHHFKEQHAAPNLFAAIVTRDRKMQTIFRYIEAIAPTSQAVMITGETGTGKELIAKALHEASSRSGDFVTVNVAGLDDIMFSDTLFGHGRGAFTGADRERKGLIEKAAGGTLFLDEIGDLNIASQVKLLRLLQEDEYYQLGSDTLRSSSARIIVATNSSIEKSIKDGTFRTDLYYRLCSHHIHVPALRERKNDIPLLVEYFSRAAAQELGKTMPVPSADTLDALLSYEYPGNVRELKGLVSNAVAVSSSGILTVAKLRPAINQPQLPRMTVDYGTLQQSTGRMPTLREAEDFLISEALRVSGGNQRSAAMILGISRQALNKRLLRDPRYAGSVT